MDDSYGSMSQRFWLGGLLPLALTVCVIAVLWRVSQPERSPALAANPRLDLFAAIDRDDLDAVRRLLDSGVTVDGREFGTSPLMRAAASGRPHIVELLLARGTEIDASDRCGTALAHAAFSRSGTETVRVLLRHGAEPNSGERRTPLILATTASNLDSMQALIAAGAAVNQRDCHGESALDIARAAGDVDAERVLLAAGAHDGNAKSRGQASAVAADR